MNFKAARLDFQRFKSIKPKVVNRPQGESLVRTSFLSEARLPLVIEPSVESVDLLEWTDLHRSFFDENYAENGEHVMLNANIATPVFFPPDKQLLWHNENSFNHLWPTKIIFCCAEPPTWGGETPIVDSRRVFELIPAKVRDVFLSKGVMYQRNYGENLGLSWQAVFKTTDRSEVEENCRRNRMEFQWKSGDRLRTRCVRPAVIRHPVIGEPSWFNQGQHWHISCLDPETRWSLEALYAEEDLPRNLYFGDGSPIPDEYMNTILDVYRGLEVSFPWRKGDVMVVDNVLVAHGRNPFEGPRKILVAMGNMKTYDDLV
jgi:alpha-ketoglutarate-dependent taurine dioxygenase